MILPNFKFTVYKRNRLCSPSGLHRLVVNRTVIQMEDASETRWTDNHDTKPSEM